MINAIILYKKLKKESEKKNPGYAGFFSIVYPGAGHIYVGCYKKGLILMLIWAFLIVLCFIGIGWIFAFPFGAYCAVDSFNKAREINHEEFLRLAQEYVKQIEHEEHKKLMLKHF